jgi:cell division protein ZapE
MSQQLTPLGVYQRDLEKAEFFADSSQQQAVEKLQRLYDHLLADRSQQNTFFRRITLLFRKQRTPVTGIYFWGGVGRGKTWLVDTFYDCLPFKNKQRIHFHRFMRDVHAELKQLRDKTDPLDIIAQNWARRVQVLCFDEFVVNDVADAVILARLARGLFARGVTIVATSNVEPKNLYLGGLQRALFLPTIDLIYQYTEVFNLDGGRDYRLEFLDRAETYLFPCNQEALADLQYNFARLAPDEDGRNTEIVVNGRPIKTVRVADGIVWLGFKELCGGPRSPSDYIELAMCYHTILLSAVPQMTRYTDNEARRFINLIDVLYDHNVNMLIAADCAVDDLYIGTRLVFEFQRTVSRLTEMQSHDYLAQQHIV